MMASWVFSTRYHSSCGFRTFFLFLNEMLLCFLLVLNSVDEPERYSTYFMKIDGVKFRQKVVPGDTLLFRVELLAPIRRGISTMKGYVFVGEKVVCEAEFMAQIVKNK